MVNEQILEYVKQQLRLGTSKESISNTLVTNGWDAASIEEAFRAAQGVVQPTPVSAPVSVVPVESKPKKHRFLKILFGFFGFIGVLAVLVFFLPNILNLFAKDIPSPNDSDLELQKVTVADADNGYSDLIQAGSLIVSTSSPDTTVINDALAGTAWDASAIADILARNKDALQGFAAANAKPSFQVPDFADPATITVDTPLPPMNVWRTLANLNDLQALSLAKQNKYTEAMDRALISVNMGEKIQSSRDDLIEYLIATVMKKSGLETAQKILATSNLSSKDLKGYAQSLQPFYKNEDGLVDALKGEYRVTAKGLDALAADPNSLNAVFSDANAGPTPGLTAKLIGGYYFELNKTKALFADVARNNVKNVTAACSDITAIQVQKLAPTSIIQMYVTENLVGDLLHDMSAAGLSTVSLKKCNDTTLVAATQTMLAIKAFKTDTKNYPATLDALVPNYLPSVPTDPFDGKELKYSADKKIVYSVGPGLQDVGGSTGSDWTKMQNPTFPLNF